MKVKDLYKQQLFIKYLVQWSHVSKLQEKEERSKGNKGLVFLKKKNFFFYFSVSVLNSPFRIIEIDFDLKRPPPQ